MSLTVFTWPDNKVRIIFCDVGQGDGALVIQGKFQMLIDVGPENNKMVACLGRYLPFWDKTIEVVIISHNDDDHSGGLKQLKSYYNVQNVYSDKLVRNDVVRYGEISFEVLGPDEDWGNDNDNSVVGRLSYSDKNILFVGDIAAAVEQKMVWRRVLPDRIDILKISHHGSAGATSEELLETVRPTEAVISVGKNNKFGHPTKIVLDRLEKFGVKIRRTDKEGDVVYVL